jgi:hypothetical protein
MIVSYQELYKMHKQQIGRALMPVAYAIAGIVLVLGLTFIAARFFISQFIIEAILNEND